jgi:hypothetical protein
MMKKILLIPNLYSRSITLPNLSSFRSAAFIPFPSKRSTALSLKKCGNKYNGCDTNPNPFKIIALTTSPQLIFSLVLTPIATAMTGYFFASTVTKKIEGEPKNLPDPPDPKDPPPG